MKQRELDVKALTELKNGQNYIVPESDYGKAEIWLINDAFFVFEIPTFGGQPNFEEVFPFTYKHKFPEKKQKAINDVLDMVYSWS